MKIKIVLCATCFCALVGGAHAACMTNIECTNDSRCTDYCCPTGGSNTTYTCPFGWELQNALSSTCVRSATTGSDDKGYTETTYGTCTGIKRTEQCYTFSSSATTGSGGITRCLSCMSVGGKV